MDIKITRPAGRQITVEATLDELIALHDLLVGGGRRNQAQKDVAASFAQALRLDPDVLAVVDPKDVG